MSEKKPLGLGDQMAHADKYMPPNQPPIGSEGVKEAEKIKSELEDFKKKVVKKFPFTLSLSILPAQSFKVFEEDEGLLPEEVSRKPLHLFMTIPEDEYKNVQKKIKPEVVSLISEGKHNVWVHIKTPVDVWNYGLDSKFEMIDAVSSSYPLYDKGFLGALRVANIHKTLVLRKFEKYVATYAVGGSLVRGTAGKDSDLDTFVVIDDTDVKKMPRMQLLEKLRGFIYDYIREASALAGVKNILNVQVYLLTDFWQSVKDATPVIFTFIRDGVPMHDRGTFLPWKLLLKMGKIKPSPEAVDTFMKYGDQNESLVKRRLIDAMVDIYWGVITPTQALMMLAGHAPPVPKTIVEDVRREFVEKEKIMSPADLKTLAWVVGLYKDYEHAKLNSISGEEIDKLLKASKEYDAHLKSLRKKLEGRLIEQTAKHVYDGLFGVLQNILGNHAPDKIIELFQKELIKHGKIPERYLPVLKEVAKIKERLKKITQGELDMVRRDAEDLMNKLVEYTQRRDMVKGEKGVLHLICGDKKADLILTHEAIFVVIEGKIQKVGPHSLVESNAAELEKAMHTQIDAKDTRLPSSALSILKKEFGEFTILF